MVQVRKKSLKRISLSTVLLCSACIVLSATFLSFQPSHSALEASPLMTASAKPNNSNTIAYAVSITGCGKDPITEGAAVLKHSIHEASIHGKGKYDYKLFAIYHPDGKECALTLKDLGYELLEREVFIKVPEIKGDFLRSRIEKNGCCGEKELIKLEAYRLTDFPIFVHLDLDVLVLKPLDDLFDMMLKGSSSVSNTDDFVVTKSIPATLNAFFTMDYNMVSPKTEYKPVQGGFLVARPSLDVYEEFRAIVKEGDFRENQGWGGKVGPFHGSMTFQGLVPYYYNLLHPGQSVELNRCVYNQMADNPRTGRTVNDVVSGECRTNTEECEDCRSRPLEDIYTVHFTLCQKPWECLAHDTDIIQQRLCRKVTKEWYRVRSDLEAYWGRPAKGPHGYQPDQFYGFCSSGGQRGYHRIEQPYGKPI